ncbi:hypothetical protein RR42_s2023 [Cupriavidus basilensis]|uniref:Uncharacterized protein n=1 Tax=Cupriavidus basilensis TaxID=68895 RepID=A0A0C4YSL6_9BURK|nr:hypothetical protein RR42_s2023 [Cupriavidus basilensis]
MRWPADCRHWFPPCGQAASVALDRRKRKKPAQRGQRCRRWADATASGALGRAGLPSNGGLVFHHSPSGLASSRAKNAQSRTAHIHESRRLIAQTNPSAT